MIGTRLGSYEVTASLGAGGMGEVYRAHDTKLNRDVAIKVVRTTFNDAPDRRARFTREAHILASLNHPNIAHVYGLEETTDGLQAIVMELIEGPTLADRLASGPIPFDEARPIIDQIVSALEAAHEQGIIHRDLKPANIKVRDDGTVKVLDFGLAKAIDPDAGTVIDAANSPTLTNRATQLGVILGTAAYMAPEQAKGKLVDKRADIWSFGVVVYEMLTGRRAFEAEDISETLAAVLTRDVDLTALPTNVTAGVRALMAECLVRDPKQRLRDIGDARLMLNRVGPGTPVSPQIVKGRRLPWLLAGIFAVAAGVLSVWLIRTSAQKPVDFPVRRLPLVLPDEIGQLSVSPDGRWLLYTAPGGGAVAKVRRLDGESTEWSDVGGTQGGILYFWSPDSRRIGFGQADALKTVDLVGSKPQTLCTGCIAGNFRGGTWNTADVIIFSSTSRPLSRIGASGGPPQTVFEIDGSRQEREHLFPKFLPDGRRFLFVARRNTGDHYIMLGSLDGGRPKEVVSGYSMAAYAAGQVLFVRNGALLAQRFDLDKEKVEGEPVIIEKNVRLATGGAATFSVSDEGTLVSAADRVDDYWWVDRSGKQIDKLDLPPNSTNARISADGRLAIPIIDPDLGSTDIYVTNRLGGGRSRLTFDPEWDLAPVWSPTGGQVMFMSQRKKPKSALYVRQSEGVEPERLLVEGESSLTPLDWSPDGHRVLIGEHAVGKTRDIMVLTMPEGTRLEPWRATEFEEAAARFSPDGGWVAHTSDENGSTQVYVRKFSDTQVFIRVTTAGGNRPVWSHDGKALYYRDPQRRLMMVTIRTSPDLAAGTPQEVFPATSGIEMGSLNYEVDSQGRFLIGLRDRTSQSESASIVFNWPMLLKR